MSRARAAIGTLPRDTQSRIPILVERSAPDVMKSILRVEVLERLADVDRRNAACYAALEDAAARFADIALSIMQSNKSKI